MKSQKIREYLARVMRVGESVDDRNRRLRDHAVENRVRMRSHHGAVAIAAEHTNRVFWVFFLSAHAVELNNVAAQFLNGDREAHARAERRLFKKENDGFSPQIIAGETGETLFAAALGKEKQIAQLGAREFSAGEAVFRFDFQCSSHFFFLTAQRVCLSALLNVDGKRCRSLCQ